MKAGLIVTYILNSFVVPRMQEFNQDFNAIPPQNCVDLDLQRKGCVVKVRVVPMAKNVVRSPIPMDFAVLTKIKPAQNHFLR